MSLTVSKLARRLNRRCQKGKNFPSLLLMTDSKRLPDPRALIPRLPVGSAIIVRGFSKYEKRTLILKINMLRRKHHLKLYVSDAPELALKYRLDGIHFSENGLKSCPDRFIKALKSRRLVITSAVHSGSALRRAEQKGIDAVLLSPVFKTQSHPDQFCLGVRQLYRWSSQTTLNCYGLGGISPHTVKKTYPCKLTGFAGISGLI